MIYIRRIMFPELDEVMDTSKNIYNTFKESKILQIILEKKS